MSFNNIEFIVLIVMMVLLFLLGLRKREAVNVGKYTGIDLPMSTALKGIACVLILMGHFAARKLAIGDTTPITRVVYLTTANIALALFMYFSGYGLSLKKPNCGGGHLSSWYNRIKKVYFPLLITCVIAMLLYTILPVKFSLEESEIVGFPKDIWYMHNFKPDYLKILAPHLFGWKDWYVFCIMIFYSFFYLSQSLTRSNPANQTWVLWLMMVVYFIFAYFYFGKAEAHWYRYCWAFFLGHVHGKTVQCGKVNKWDVLMLVGLLVTIIVESRFMILSYITAVLIIIVCSLINKKYYINSCLLAFMGGISYFFYLSHERLGYTAMAYTEINSVILWVVITIIISFALKATYDCLLLKKSR